MDGDIIMLTRHLTCRHDTRKSSEYHVDVTRAIPSEEDCHYHLSTVDYCDSCGSTVDRRGSSTHAINV